MAQQPRPQYDIPYQKVKLIKTERLGMGSYGAVYKVMCNYLPCAAKILHPTLFQFTAPGKTSVGQMFELECRLLSAIRHPHIVQYLGMSYDPESGLPVLLMELMDESLTRFLERAQDPLPYHTEVNLCHDITLALSYLHSNGILHRDLSSNNVLLIAGSRAKVTDFGMAKLYDVNRTSFTQCPGTLVYMPPEALSDPPVYTCKLDSFSFGVLCVQIVTRQFPNPSNRVTRVESSQSPTGVVEVPVPEIERRKSHIHLIDPAHSLMQVVHCCLKDRDIERPSTQQLCHYISELKILPEYVTSVQQSQVRSAQIHRESSGVQSLQQELSAIQLRTQSDQVQSCQQSIQQQSQQILELRNLLTLKNEQLSGKEHQHHELEGVITACQQEIEQLREQLQSSEQVTAEFQQTLSEREGTIQELQRQIQELQQHTQNLQLLLQSKDHQLQGQQQEIQQLHDLFITSNDPSQTLQQQFNRKDEQLADKDHQLQQKEAAIAAHQQEIQQLRQQLQSSEQVTAEFQRNLLEISRGETVRDQQGQIRELQQQPRHRGGQRREEEEASGAPASRRSIKLMWRDCGWAPRKMYREATAVDGNMAYFLPGQYRSAVILTVNSENSEWSELPECPNHNFSLAVVNGRLTAIGGQTPNNEVTNSLHSFFLTKKKWAVWFPPMPTKRWLTAVVCSATSLVVAGGEGERFKKLSTVEVMDLATLKWSTASSLPHPLYQAHSATLCGDQLYLLGGFDQQKRKLKSVFTCSLSSLLQSCHGQLGARLRGLFAIKSDVWHKIADTQFYFSTSVQLHGQLLAIGGEDSDKRPTNAVHLYNTTTNSWEVVSHMATPRCQCSVAVLPNNELVVVGGHMADGQLSDSVEIATIV